MRLYGLEVYEVCYHGIKTVDIRLFKSKRNRDKVARELSEKLIKFRDFISFVEDFND